MNVVSYLVNMIVNSTLTFEVITTNCTHNVSGTFDLMEEERFVVRKVLIAATTVIMAGVMALMLDKVLLAEESLGATVEGTRNSSSHIFSPVAVKEFGIRLN